MAIAVGVILLLVHGSAMAGEAIKAEGPAAKRGWVVVVRPGYGMLSARLTDELKGECGTRWFDAADGTRVSVLNNVRLVLSAPEWSVTASRVYTCAVDLLTDLVYLDPPGIDLSDEQAAALLLAYASFRWAEQTTVLFCPPRAQLEWTGDSVYEPMIQGASKINAELTIRLDDRTPIVLKGAHIRVEQNSGRILVSRNADAK
jgi:hypothetical protein